MVETVTSGRKRGRSETEGNSVQCAQSTDEGENHDVSVKKKKPRGRTCLQVMATGEKEKKLVEWNSKGQPIGAVSVKFSSTMGVIVREQVPIVIDNWHGVKDLARDSLWTLLMAKSLKMREIRAKQTLTHTLSRKGYARKEDEHNKEHPDKPLTKPQLWIEAHVSKKKTSEANAAKIAEVQKKIDEATDDGEDILTQVLGPERPGHIRGVGAGVTKTKLYAQAQSDAKIEKLEAKLQVMTTKYQKIEAALASKLGISLEDDDESGEVAPTISKTKVQCNVSASPQGTATPKSGQGSTHQPSIHDKCKLLNWNGNGEVVARGSLSATDPKSTVHGYTLGPDCYRVSIEDVFVERAEFYRSEPEFANLEDARGSTIAWPTKYIVFDD